MITDLKQVDLLHTRVIRDDSMVTLQVRSGVTVLAQRVLANATQTLPGEINTILENMVADVILGEAPRINDAGVLVNSAGTTIAVGGTPKKIYGQQLPTGRLTVGSSLTARTSRVAQTVPRAFKRVRAHLFNIDTANACVGAKAQISNSESFANGSRPTIGGVLSNAGWTPFLFSGSITVTLPVGPSAGVPSVTTSDWLDLASIPSVGPLPIVYTDRLIPSGNTAAVGHAAQGSAWSSAFAGLPGNTKEVRFYQQDGIDAIADPGAFTSTAAQASTFPLMLEFEFYDGTLSMMAFGDSTEEGSVGNFANATLGPPVMVQAQCAAAGLPLCVSTFCHGGTTAALSYSKAVSVLAKTRPDILYFQPYSVNDGGNYTTTLAATLTRIQDLVKLANDLQVKLIMTTPKPRVIAGGAALSGADLTSLEIMETTILQCASSNVRIVDLRELHDPTKRGVWASAYGADNFHPNQVGYSLITSKLFEVLQSM